MFAEILADFVPLLPSSLYSLSFENLLHRTNCWLKYFSYMTQEENIYSKSLLFFSNCSLLEIDNGINVTKIVKFQSRFILN